VAVLAANNALPVADAGSELPGEDEIDRALIDRVVEQLNATWRHKGLETARALGEVVLAAFFGGDLAAFAARERRHLSFRALAEREDLNLSYGMLRTAMAVFGQLRALPVSVAEALPLSHHKALLPLKDDTAKVRLAVKAATEG